MARRLLPFLFPWLILLWSARAFAEASPLAIVLSCEASLVLEREGKEGPLRPGARLVQGDIVRQSAPAASAAAASAPAGQKPRLSVAIEGAVIAIPILPFDVGRFIKIPMEKKSADILSLLFSGALGGDSLGRRAGSAAKGFEPGIFSWAMEPLSIPERRIAEGFSIALGQGSSPESGLFNPLSFGLARSAEGGASRPLAFATVVLAESGRPLFPPKPLRPEGDRALIDLGALGLKPGIAYILEGFVIGEGGRNKTFSLSFSLLGDRDLIAIEGQIEARLRDDSGKAWNCLLRAGMYVAYNLPILALETLAAGGFDLLPFMQAREE